VERTDQASELTVAETATTTQPYRDRRFDLLIGYAYDTGSRRM
jgi:hypothetical protein